MPSLTLFNAAGAAASEVAVVSGSLAAGLAAASEVVAGAVAADSESDSVAYGSAAARAARPAHAQVAQAAACPGERVACAE